jgi:hypothetical protein
MISEPLQNERFFYELYIIDTRIAEYYRRMPCPHCNGPLYFSNYFRIPRGETVVGLPKEYFIRYSLCCGNEGCRRRVIPPSCRFLDRKVYWHAAILIIMSEFQNTKVCVFKLAKKFNISRNTIARWIKFYQNIFPSSRKWQKIRGMVAAFITNDELPSNLVNHFLNLKSSAQDALISCLKFLSKGSGFCHKIRAG